MDRRSIIYRAFCIVDDGRLSERNEREREKTDRKQAFHNGVIWMQIKKAFWRFLSPREYFLDRSD